MDGEMEGGKDGWWDGWMVRDYRRRQWHGGVGLSAAGVRGGCGDFSGNTERCPQNWENLITVTPQSGRSSGQSSRGQIQLTSSRSTITGFELMLRWSCGLYMSNRRNSCEL